MILKNTYTYKIKYGKCLRLEGVYPSTSTFILDLDPNLGNENQILMYPSCKQCSICIFVFIFFADMNLDDYYISISTQLVVLTSAVALFRRRTVGGKV
jgi:hypothetical protein